MDTDRSAKQKGIVSQSNIEKVRAVFPNVITEAGIDFNLLKQELSGDIAAEKESFEFTWSGKKDAIAECTLPVGKILSPCAEDSSDWENTGNIYIEGDNLDALKLMREDYRRRIKVIYIDPPYNTGKDFIYKDTFGRSHSDWCSMMHPRLKLSYDLLTEDGIIFISIDGNEIVNLLEMCNAIFGEENRCNIFVWVNNLKGRQISGSGAVATYEFIVCYCKNKSEVPTFTADVAYLKKIMPDVYKGFNYIVQTDGIGEYVLKNELHNTNRAFNEETRPNLVFNIHYDPIQKLVLFSDADDAIEYEGFVKIPPRANSDGVHRYHAWRWSKAKIAAEPHDLEFIAYKDGYRIYTKIRDHATTNLKDILTNIPTNIGTAELAGLFDGKSYFDFPKSTVLLKLLLKSIRTDRDAVILDYFSGSATTADAVMQLNAEDGGNRRFILAQIPVRYGVDSPAFAAGYETLCDFGKERIRRAGARINAELAAKERPPIDCGFRVYKIV